MWKCNGEILCQCEYILWDIQPIGIKIMGFLLIESCQSCDACYFIVYNTWVISHVPMFHITQPLDSMIGINGLLDGYYFG